MTKELERRSLVQEFRVSAPDEPTTITGYAAVFDSPGQGPYWIEELDPHAFDTVLATNPDVRALFNHDPNLVLGRTTAQTLTLSVDARGLQYVVNPPDTQLAKDLIVSMRRKDITGSSFGFIVARDQWTENKDGSVTRRILEVEELVDVSPVTYPAYDASSASVRSLPKTMPAEFRSRFERRDASNCECDCPQCSSAACGICSADPQCAGADRTTDEDDDQIIRTRLALAEAS